MCFNPGWAEGGAWTTGYCLLKSPLLLSDASGRAPLHPTMDEAVSEEGK